LLVDEYMRLTTVVVEDSTPFVLVDGLAPFSLVVLVHVDDSRLSTLMPAQRGAA